MVLQFLVSMGEMELCSVHVNDIGGAPFEYVHLLPPLQYGWTPLIWASLYGTPNKSIIDVTKSYAFFIRCCEYRLLLTFDVAIIDCF